MSTVFLYGPLAWDAIARAIIGHPVTLEPATLDGHGLNQNGRYGFPTLFTGDGQVNGVILRRSSLPEGAQDRMSYFAHGLGYGAVTHDVTVNDQPCEATLFVPPQAEVPRVSDWEFEVWKDRWGATALHMAEEVGQHFGTVPAHDLPRMMPMIQVRAAARVAAAPGVPAQVRSDLSADRVEVEEQANRHAGFFLTRGYTLRHPTFDGGMSAPVNREVFVATDAAIVLPYDPVRDRLLLVEQFRMGPFGRGDPLPWMLEPVAGRVDPGEPPEVTARRECAEEAGITLTNLEHISSHYCSPGCSTEYFHCFLGLCDLPSAQGGIGGLDTEHEDIRTHVLPFDEAFSLIASGEAANGPLVLCLLWLQRERERLRAGA